MTTSCGPSWPLRLARRALVAAVLPVMTGCGPVADGDALDTSTSELNATYGIDYAWVRPTTDHIKSQGYSFVVRYLSYDNTGKNLTAAEASRLRQAGLEVVSNWEWTTSDALGGFAQGVTYAKEAERQALAAGMPAGRPIYFSVDYDAPEADQATINAYFDGVASVLGRSRTGAYGGYHVIKRLFDAGKITWGWQTYAWSGGVWDARAQLRQIQNGLEGGPIDKDQAMAADYGQWGVDKGAAPIPPSNCKVSGDRKLYCTNAANAPLYRSPNLGSGVVDRLASTSSWFTCWGTGQLHVGGNTTWYFTAGDYNGAWGWSPAAALGTNAAFDANPAASGLPKCQ